MKKPEIQTREHYDYIECKRYMEKKYGKKVANGLLEHLGEIHNGCFQTLSTEDVDSEYWEDKEALATYKKWCDEFIPEGKYEVEIYVWW